jgi:hypothetical protein
MVDPTSAVNPCRVPNSSGGVSLASATGRFFFPQNFALLGAQLLFSGRGKNNASTRFVQAFCSSSHRF